MKEEDFTRQWAGYATAKVPYELPHSRAGNVGPWWQLVERFGERPEEWKYKGFLSTTDREDLKQLTEDYPQRWHIEEFFNTDQALGWDRAGTQNVHIRYGQMTMALIAQAVLSQFRRRVGSPYSEWDANHMAKDVLFGLEGDVRLCGDTVLVTYYNAPNASQLSEHYSDLPDRLADEGIAPEVPWLYGYKLDFRFR